ncbi:MAG: carbohydrate kinase family protein [Planctomycetota bacterium]|nr:carbohydrate kinase family protein [Planctomycetota bacterium]
MSHELRTYDCLVCGEVCVDLPIRSIDRHTPLADMDTVRVDPILPGSGGIVSNSGMAFARLGLRAAAFACVGDDIWADVLLKRFEAEGLDTSPMLRLPHETTSATAVLIGDDGEHTFAYHAGASRRFDRAVVESRHDLFEQAEFALFGYYALMPQLEQDLPAVLQEIRQLGCRTAMDSAGGGGGIEPLDRILPELDVYVPSFKEGHSQTALNDPRAMIEAYRRYAPDALLGIKLGDRGALLSPSDGEWIEIPPVDPPGSVTDTTGAGDCFYAGLIAGLVRGFSPADAGRIAAAAGACSVTKIGAIEGLRSFDETRQLAGLSA